MNAYKESLFTFTQIVHLNDLCKSEQNLREVA